MGNHYHFLLKSREGRLSAGMQRLSSNFTHAMNERHDRDGPLFRGRFASVEIDDNAGLVQVLRYIHLNPMEARLLRRAEDWRWSSAAAYAGVRAMGLTPTNLETSELLSLFGSPPHQAYAEFMAAGIDDNTRRAYDAKRWS